ncbi:ABC transporter substrate-binding protein [Pseudomonas sp. BMW13]|uniref:ABC transporter substrate-binding protein n=1 Tax=Pseudomonas sp. BMW13 TaxID=2562590 RepID=UPI001582A031|nr:ABC transporter substrate-binding protein [Pseudomonas sp. BMW13]
MLWKRNWPWALALCCVASIDAAQAASQLRVVSFGGSVRDAQREAFYRPFREASDVVVVSGSYNGDFGKLRKMQAMQHVSWDVIEVEAPELVRGCEEGLFQPIDASALGDTSSYLPGAIRPCGVGIFVWSMALAYDSKRFGQAPTGWADFWDVQKFPGKRGLRKGAKYNLEFALLADGVPAQQIYARLASEAGVRQAFAKLEQIKADIHWWEAGEEPVRRLRDGSVAMSAAYSGRIATAQDQGDPLQLIWAGSVYDFDYWAIPQGSFNTPQAQAFIRFASQADAQRAFSEQIPYGPIRQDAQAGLDAQRLARLPTAPQNLEQALPMGVEFWIEHGADLEARFEQWASR